MIERKNCYIYTRVSTEGQVDGFSLDAQKDSLMRYASYSNMNIIGEYCDAGKSGKSINGRNEFKRMISDITSERDKVDYVLVFKLSRFGRNAADVLTSLQLIQDYGVNLICVEDGIDSSRDSGKFTITVLSAVAEIERENILVQCEAGRHQKAREGKWGGGAVPFGYKRGLDGKLLLADGNDSEVVKMIFNLYAYSDMSVGDIASYLNNRGYKKQANRSFELEHFTRDTVSKILDNPVYIGKIAYGKTANEKIKGTRDQYHRIAKRDYKVYEGMHEALIDEETWNAVRRRRSDNKTSRMKEKETDHEHKLSGLIKCPVCGANLVGTYSRYKKKSGELSIKYYYRCMHAKSKKCTFKTQYAQDSIDEEVKDVIFKLAKDETLRAFIIKGLEAELNLTKLEEEKTNTEERLEQLICAKNKIASELEGSKTLNRKYSDLLERKTSLDEKIKNAQKEALNAKEKLDLIKGGKITSSSLLSIFEDFESLYDKFTEKEKKHFYSLVIDSIEINDKDQNDKNIIREINFRLYMELCKNSRTRENTGEVIALMSKI